MKALTRDFIRGDGPTIVEVGGPVIENGVRPCVLDICGAPDAGR